MPRDLERRLRRLEMARAGSRKLALWYYDEADGTFVGAGGERMTEEALYRRYPPGSPEALVTYIGHGGDL